MRAADRRLGERIEAVNQAAVYRDDALGRRITDLGLGSFKALTLRELFVLGRIRQEVR